MPSRIDIGTFWHAIGMRATGAVVVTASGADGPAGLLGLSASHVSASPPTVLVSIGNATGALSAILESGAFALNFLSEDQTQLADSFGGRTDRKGAARFEGVPWHVLETGAPVLDDTVGAIDCRLVQRVPFNDTLIVFGAVQAVEAGRGRRPLILFEGRYHSLAHG